jgi:peptide/nickel transport system permease protein
VIRFILSRLIRAVPIVLGAATVIFFVVNLAPGDPAQMYLVPGMTDEVVQQIRANFGLDQPLPVRYVRWMAAMLTGDLGMSLSQARPVTQVIADYLPQTILLTATALVVSFALGIFVGTIQAWMHRRATDQALSVTLLFFYSMPSFWLAIMLVLAFSLYARNVWGLPFYFPASGMYSIEYETLSLFGKIRDVAWHLFLPALSLSLVLTAGIARYMRGSMLEVIRQDFVRTARAKGLPEHAVVFRHALRNALLPIVTLVGLYVPFLFSGAVFVEYVFAWPGMGRAVVEAILQRDGPVVMGASLLFAGIVVLGNLLADVLYAVVDPRIRYG